ncbi:hypothetical protein LWI28_013056 [Acer negundo]|uniref:Small auxin up regulated protein n=1 Tax=Acer negundo TaxID=4023 RepID=A0AAD5IER9_ACENE|nr:hypothetical protein LWI28_013056 [Acer negundo]KAK4838937.1 hypothetical protein QYF36_017674 [Acer negundo]
MISVNPSKVMHHVYPINKPKKILHLWWSWAYPHHHQHHHKKTATITANKHYLLEASHENSKELLFKGSELSDGKRAPKANEDVPKGFLAVYVGPELRRFVIPMSYLSMPEFRVLMDSVAEEYGFEHEGGLQIPCEEQDFVDILRKCVTMDRMMYKSKKKH